MQSSRSRHAEVVSLPRRTVVWLGESGLNEATAALLQRSGVDLLVTPRGEVDLSGQLPVFRMAPAPAVAGSIPVALALDVTGVRSDLEEEMAAAVWRAIVEKVGDSIPAEIILDLPRLPDGVSDFVDRLSAESGLPVIPVLSIEQLREREAIQTARAARACVIPAYGTRHSSVRGVGQLATQSLVERLAPLVDSGARVRLGSRCARCRSRSSGPGGKI